MSIFERLREKSLNRKQEDINRMANDLITLSDSESRIYIAYQGNPLVLIDENLTAGAVMGKLIEVRRNFIDAKLKELC